MAYMDIGIDLGTVNMVVTMGKKVLLNEPSVVAYHKIKKEIIAVGRDAYEMLGRTPDYITIIKPLADGVISNDSMAEIMIEELILKVIEKHLIRPRIMLCVPSYITDVESRALIESTVGAGSRKIYLIQEPIAALLGAGIDVSKPEGNMIVDIGGGTTDIAIVSLNGVVNSKSIKIAGNELDKSILKYISNRYKMLIGEKKAEEIKIKLGNVFNPSPDKKMKISGKNLYNGLPKTIEINEIDVHIAMDEHISEIFKAIKEVLETTSPELITDIYDKGVLLTGGGSLLKNIDIMVNTELGLKCKIAEDAITCVAKGTVLAFKKLDTLLEGFENVIMQN